jgi:hypothetical protein
MMQRFLVLRLFVSALIAILVVFSSTNLALAATRMTEQAKLPIVQSSGPGDTVATCLGNVLLQVVGILADGEEFTFGKLANSASTCVDAAVAIFDAASNPTSSSPRVDVNVSPSLGYFSGAVWSTSLGNCTDVPRPLQFNFAVPFEMVVGPQGRQGYFKVPPSGFNDNELVARRLFSQFGGQIAGSTTSGPSQSAIYNVGPHTQVIVILPILVFYRLGEARIVHIDGSTSIIPWLYTNGYRQNGRITYMTTRC